MHEEGKLLGGRFLARVSLGSGAYGVVTRAVDMKTGHVVAVKKLKKAFGSWQECIETVEVRCLSSIRHQNVVRLLAVFREAACLHLVFEHCDSSLLDVIKTEAPTPLPVLADVACQLLTALAHIHSRGIFHRDVKPENVLLTGRTQAAAGAVKLADFGLAKEISAKPPFTQYISTRWYRAPEVLVRAEYGPPVDVWAVGVIMAEVVTKQPLFPGLSDADMLDKLSRILGPPDHSTWTEGVRRAFAAGYSTYSKQTTTLRDAVPGASSTALEFLSSLIVMNPTHRPTCAEALDSRFLLNSGVDDA